MWFERPRSGPPKSAAVLIVKLCMVKKCEKCDEHKLKPPNEPAEATDVSSPIELQTVSLVFDLNLIQKTNTLLSRRMP